MQSLRKALIRNERRGIVKVKAVEVVGRNFWQVRVEKGDCKKGWLNFVSLFK